MTGTYEFTQDKITIIDPSIFSIDEDNVAINNTDKTLSVMVVLIDPVGSKFSPVNAFCAIPRDADTWDECDLLAVVTKRLEEFKVY